MGHLRDQIANRIGLRSFGIAQPPLTLGVLRDPRCGKLNGETLAPQKHPPKKERNEESMQSKDISKISTEMKTLISDTSGIRKYRFYSCVRGCESDIRLRTIES